MQMGFIWFWLVAVMMVAYVVLDGFDLGVGILYALLGRSEKDRQLMLRAIGPVWDGNEVWLIAGGGTLYFAFPALYSAAFSGFYLALMMVLWLLILRGISIELRSHIESPIWKPFWDLIFGGSSALLALLYGAALGNVVRGVPLDSDGFFFIPLWTNLQPGPEAGIVDWYTLLIGVAAFTALALHGCYWVILKTTGDLKQRSREFASRLSWALLAFSAISTFFSFRLQPNIAKEFADHVWGYVFPLLAVTGLAGMKVWSARARDLSAFLC